MRFFFVIICLFSITVLKGQEYSRKELNYMPKNLTEAIQQLHILHHDTTKQKILVMTEEEFVAESHFGLGMWIRNNWGLWKGKELAKYFNSIGIFHPDDMSGIILTSYYRDLHGQEWRVEEQVSYYQDYWKKSSEHIQKTETDTSYQRMVDEQMDSIRLARLEQKKQLWSPGKKVSGFVDYKCGLLGDFFLRTAIEGTIISWEDDGIVLLIDKYVDERKKKGVMKCNGVRNDTVYIKNHELFQIIEN